MAASTATAVVGSIRIENVTRPLAHQGRALVATGWIREACDAIPSVIAPP